MTSYVSVRSILRSFDCVRGDVLPEPTATVCRPNCEPLAADRFTTDQPRLVARICQCFPD